MIPDEEELNQPIDFTWFWFIGAAKLGLSFKETGRMTLKMFNKLYQHYKDDWSFEMRLRKNNMTYGDARRKSEEIEDNF